jgi:hypothetical protein
MQLICVESGHSLGHSWGINNGQDARFFPDLSAIEKLVIHVGDIGRLIA